MKLKFRAINGAAVGLIVSLPWLALVYLGQVIAKFPLIPAELFEALTRLLPGSVVTSGLEAMIQGLQTLRLGQTAAMGKSVEFALAYLISLVGLTALGGIYAVILEKWPAAWRRKGSLVGLALALLVTPMTLGSGLDALPGLVWSWLLSLAWGLALAWGVQSALEAASIKEDSQRKRALVQLSLGSLALSGLAIGLGRWLAANPKETPIAEALETPLPPVPSPTSPPTKAGFSPVPGSRPEITPIEDFYRVDINLLPPGQEEFAGAANDLTKRLLIEGETDLPSESYILVVDGLVEKPLALSLSTLKAFPMIEQFATLSCISNPVGGDLIGTTLFQGARLRDILERAGLKPEAVQVKFTCVDGYTESLPIESALDERTLLCYSMGHEPLSQGHGAPIRLYTPNRFGMKNPKWIILIEATGEGYLGFWEQRGWSEQAWIQSTAVIDAIQAEGQGRTQVGGIAFAGSRGITRVELSVDGGAWLPVQINRPLSPLTWVLWSSTIALLSGAHTITARAVDGLGQLQTPEESGSHPDGATGYHSKAIDISG